MGIIELTNKYKKNLNLKKSEEYLFFKAYKFCIAHQPYLCKYLEYQDSFSLIQSTIIIRAMLNKIRLERNLMEHESNLDYYMNETAESLIHVDVNGTKVYIPFFPLTHNIVYLKSPEKLLKMPFSILVSDFKDTIINPFDEYNYALYQSDMTILMTIGEDETSRAFYHPNFKVIYIINNQGTLDAKIYLFDKFLSNPNYDNIIKRVKDVVDKYYAFDKDGFVNALLKNKLISFKLYKIYKKSL